jgi:hypothetical protein
MYSISIYSDKKMRHKFRHNDHKSSASKFCIKSEIITTFVINSSFAKQILLLFI